MKRLVARKNGKKKNAKKRRVVKRSAKKRPDVKKNERNRLARKKLVAQRSAAKEPVGRKHAAKKSDKKRLAKKKLDVTHVKRRPIASQPVRETLTMTKLGVKAVVQKLARNLVVDLVPGGTLGETMSPVKFGFAARATDPKNLSKRRRGMIHAPIEARVAAGVENVSPTGDTIDRQTARTKDGQKPTLNGGAEGSTVRRKTNTAPENAHSPIGSGRLKEAHRTPKVRLTQSGCAKSAWMCPIVVRRRDPGAVAVVVHRRRQEMCRHASTVSVIAASDEQGVKDEKLYTDCIDYRASKWS